MEDTLFELYYSQVHRNEELERTIEELQGALKYRKNENISLAEENKKLKSCLTIADNDYKKCYAENIRLAEENNKRQCDSNELQQAINEIKLLNKQIDKLIAENNDLRFRRKMLVKHLLNIMYGFDYADTDSIKAESEAK